MDAKGNFERVNGFPTSDIGSLLQPIYAKRDRPFSPKSKSEVYVMFAGEKRRLEDLIPKGIAIEEKYAELELKTDVAKKDAIRCVGGEDKFYGLPVKTTVNITDIMYNVGGDFTKYPKTARLLAKLAADHNCVNNREWRNEFLIEVLEICKSNGKFLGGLFTRRLANVEGILGGKLEDKDIDYINKNLPSRIKDRKNFNLSYNEEKQEYIVKSESV